MKRKGNLWFSEMATRENVEKAALWVSGLTVDKDGNRIFYPGKQVKSVEKRLAVHFDEIVDRVLNEIQILTYDFGVIQSFFTKKVKGIFAQNIIVMNEIITTAIALGSSTISSLVTFLLARRKYLAEVKGSDLENLQKSLQIYIDIVEDNKKRIDLYQAEIERCNKEVFALRTENRDLRNQLQSLSLQIIRQNKPNYNHSETNR